MVLFGMVLNRFTIGMRVCALAGFLMLTILLVGGLSIRASLADQRQFAQFSAEASEFEQAVNLARGAQVTFKVQIQEWKNLLLRGGDTAARDKYHQAFVKEGEQTQARLNELREVMQRRDLPLADVDAALDALRQLSTRYLEAFKQYDPAQPDASAHLVDKLVKGLDRPPTEKIDGIVAFIIRAASESRAADVQAVQSRMQDMLIVMVSTLCVALLIGVVGSVVIYRSISGPLKHAVRNAAEVAEGKLTVGQPMDGRDEVSQLSRAMASMSGSLSKVVSQVRDAAHQVAHAAGEIASGNMDLSNRTETQASNLQQTVTTIDQITQGVQHSADHAKKAHELAAQANDVAEQGGHAVSRVVQTMDEIHGSARRIGEIIGVIDGIAFQTNILALNAAVEAARAGEQGRGFAVVASEVRALAQRSANAAREIKALIQDSVNCADRGNTLVGEAGQAITSTMQAVKAVRDVIAEITASTHQQAADIVLVSRTVAQIDAGMQQNAALVEEAAAASASLEMQARSLRETVAFFQD